MIQPRYDLLEYGLFVKFRIHKIILNPKKNDMIKSNIWKNNRYFEIGIIYSTWCLLSFLKPTVDTAETSLEFRNGMIVHNEPYGSISKCNYACKQFILRRLLIISSHLLLQIICQSYKKPSFSSNKCPDEPRKLVFTQSQIMA